MPISKTSALRRLRAAIDPDLDFVVGSVKTVHRSTPAVLEATVMACEGKGRDAHCYPVRVTVKTRYDISLGNGRKRRRA